jgi:signal transduction histidine kinase/ActR/RegA family two-component response regulator
MWRRHLASKTRQPLARIFLPRLLLAYIALGAVVFSLQIGLEFSHQRETVVRDLRSLGTSLQPGVAIALWDYQDGALRALLDGISRHPDVAQVRIHQADTSLNLDGSAPGRAAPSPRLQVEVPIQKTLPNGESRLLGHLLIASSEERLWERTTAALAPALVAGGTVLASMGLVAWALVHTLVVRPLSRFSKQVKALEPQSENPAIDLVAPNVAEMVHLQRVFQRLMHQIQEHQHRIEEQNANLERKVHERTRSLEAANQAKKEFLARMSHEIRTPLGAVTGLTHLLLRTELTPQQRDWLQKSLSSGQLLMSIINEVLDYSKLEAGKLNIECVNMSLADIIRRVFDTLEVKAAEGQIALELTQEPNLPDRLLGDPVRLEQVLLNLLGNAVKFTPQGRVGLHVGLRDRQPHRVELEFLIHDTGIGITTEQQAQLFQPFHQADGSITRRFGGTGLGLALSRQLVELMGGTLTLRSEPGRGSEFRVTLGFEIAPEIESPPDSNATAAKGQSPDNANARPATRVLLVEDNPVNQLLATSFLQLNGLAVDVADNGLRGVEMATSGHYPLVLMDVQMPLMDGLTAARRIRATPGFETLPIIAMTAYAMDEDIRSSFEAGMNDHLTKPIDPDRLAQVLRRWLVSPADGNPPQAQT